MFHFLTSGQCWLEVQGAERRLLRPGDLALVPHGEGHRLASEPGITTTLPPNTAAWVRKGTT